MNLLKQEKPAKIGIKNKQLIAGLDDKYLGKVLSSASAGQSWADCRALIFRIIDILKNNNFNRIQITDSFALIAAAH